MSSLLLKNIPETIHEKLKERAALNHRSMNKQAMSILEEALLKPSIGSLPSPVKTRTHLSAAWVTKAKKWGRL